MKLDKAIKGYLLDCRVRNLSIKTIQWYDQKLHFFAHWLDEDEDIQEIRDITIAHLRAFILHLQTIQVGRRTINKGEDTTQVSPLTSKGYVQVIKGFFTWCELEEIIEKNPSKRLSLPTVPDYLIPTFTHEHIRLMLDSCDLTNKLGQRDRTIMLVLLETGIRVSELCGMRIQDIHDDYIRVVGKGIKEREVGIAPAVSKQLWKYINQYRTPTKIDDPRVFINRYGRHLTPSGVEQLLIDIKERVGITGVRVSAHTFRHTFACMYLEQGGEIYKLSRLMGHSSVEVTEEYLKNFNIRAARREYDKFSPVSNLDLLAKKKSRRKPASN
ncbi:tyrosine recombinase XerD [Dictyobacter vulcani]|uniref:Tyrosine recombinase XerD n=1 Tax=Dictyobacter vulcani TaxID=2607529 RepID=A0A5J4KM61_9CHLR|nr:tyrosine-type recombinase/integrase [Dictyobacter vulcani]GER88883.1 tyrosine recombinase XerD [Dictyobacter vulcani]